MKTQIIIAASLLLSQMSFAQGQPTDQNRTTNEEMKTKVEFNREISRGELRFNPNFTLDPRKPLAGQMTDRMIDQTYMKSSEFRGHDQGGGGDPRDLPQAPFPDRSRLQQARNLLATNLGQLSYPESFETKFLAELDHLIRNDLIIVVEIEGIMTGGGRHKGDYSKLVNAGAWTEFSPGAPIYLSNRVLSYDLVNLARTLAQEIPHHILPDDLRFLEDFVNGLGESIAQNQFELSYQQALETGRILTEQSSLEQWLVANEKHLKSALKLFMAQETLIMPDIRETLLRYFYSELSREEVLANGRRVIVTSYQVAPLSEISAFQIASLLFYETTLLNKSFRSCGRSLSEIRTPMYQVACGRYIATLQHYITLNTDPQYSKMTSEQIKQSFVPWSDRRRDRNSEARYVSERLYFGQYWNVGPQNSIQWTNTQLDQLTYRR